MFLTRITDPESPEAIYELINSTLEGCRRELESSEKLLRLIPISINLSMCIRHLDDCFEIVLMNYLPLEDIIVCKTATMPLKYWDYRDAIYEKIELYKNMLYSIKIK